MQKYFTLILCLIGLSAFSQEVLLEGYTYSAGNRGYLSQVYLRVQDAETNKTLGETYSDKEGYFSMTIPEVKTINVFAKKTMFKMHDLDLRTKPEKMFVKIEMIKEPGYLFEVTLAEKRNGLYTPTDAITGARIEVYNNTTRRPELVIEESQSQEFDVKFEKGNHYTILIRKPGYLSKRMEAHVDIDGCILCFEGVGKVDPGVADNLTDKNAAGVLLANVELEPIFEGKTLGVENINYALGKWNINKKAREQLKTVILLMEDNPNLKLELGSHTDSRGKSSFNKNLSEKRARSAVEYIVINSNVNRDRVSSRGYGEEKILNKCKDGVICSESEHSINRRTELKILGIDDITNYKPLAQMKMEEFLEAEVLNQEEVRIVEGEDVDEILAEKDKTNTENRPSLEIEKKETAKDAVSRILADKKSEDSKKTNFEKVKTIEKSETTDIVKEKVKPEVKKKIKTKKTTEKVVTKVKQKVTEKTEEIESVKKEVSKDNVDDQEKVHKAKTEELKPTYLEVEQSYHPRPPAEINKEIAPPINNPSNQFLNGHKIVIHKGKEMLAEDDTINKRHDNLELYFADNDEIWYLIGGFRSQDSAKDALKYLIVTYPDAYVVGFQDGELK